MPVRAGNKRLPLPFRGKGIQVQGKALYLIHPNKIATFNSGNFAVRLRKLTFAFIVLVYAELEVDGLEKAEAHVKSEALETKNIGGKIKIFPALISSSSPDRR